MIYAIYLIIIINWIRKRNPIYTIIRFVVVYLSIIEYLTWHGFKSDISINILSGVLVFQLIEIVSVIISVEMEDDK